MLIFCNNFVLAYFDTWDRKWFKFITAGRTEVLSFDLIRPRLQIEKDIESLGIIFKYRFNSL